MGQNSYWKFGETSTVVYYFCDNGFKELEGKKTLICSVDAISHTPKWNGKPLSCTGKSTISIELKKKAFNIFNN